MTNRKQTAAIKEFVADYGSSVHARGTILARELGCRELRSKRVDHLALIWNDQNDAYVLCADGIRRQLLGKEIGCK